jgi:hypothetical protein
MDLHTPARWAGLAGGLCWVLRLVLGRTGSGTGPLPDLLFWLGAALLAVALAAAGSELVSRGTGWLRVVVAIAFPLLVASVLEFLHPVGDPQVVDGVLALAVVAWAVAGLRRTHGERPRRETTGARRREPQRSAGGRPGGSHSR